MHLDTVMITMKILFFAIAYADDQDDCKQMERTLTNKCQESCTPPRPIFCCRDCKPKKDCSCTKCICNKFPDISVNIGIIGTACSNYLNDVCNALKLPEQPTTGSSNVADGTQTTKNVIIGCVVGGVLVIVLILIAAFLIFRHVRRRKRASAQGVTNMTSSGYQYMTTEAPKSPVAPYDNLVMTAPPGEQNPKPAQQMGSGLNDNSNGEAGYDNAQGQVHAYEEIGAHEITHSDASGRVDLFGAVTPPGESGETTLLDNEFYGRSNKENEGGETIVVDNDFYQ